ncbi:MAG: 2,3-bisphosphoglycerate-independent phosphoglycerate mutase, partial [Clostridiales bacterium]
MLLRIPALIFDRGNKAPKVNYICMTSYDDTLKNASVAFLPSPPVNTLGKILSRNGLRQLRIAETEKYAHVTFFFNGGVEQMEIGEDRVMIPSPSVETYDLMPEMNSSAVTKAVIDRIESGIYDVIVLNYANPDMIGHTGNVQATVLALNAVDACLGQVEKAVRDMGGTLFITADHGNVEKMISDEGKPMTSHTTGLVPFIFVDDKLAGVRNYSSNYG